jgi:hypothetical protein
MLRDWHARIHARQQSLQRIGNFFYRPQSIDYRKTTYLGGLHAEGGGSGEEGGGNGDLHGYFSVFEKY